MKREITGNIVIIASVRCHSVYSIGLSCEWYCSASLKLQNIDVLQNLEELLRGYLGCVIVVSHDRCVTDYSSCNSFKAAKVIVSTIRVEISNDDVCRAFMKNAVDTMFILEGGGESKVQRFAGDYEEYIAFIEKKKAEQQLQEAAAANAAREESAAAKASEAQTSTSSEAVEVLITLPV